MKLVVDFSNAYKKDNGDIADVAIVLSKTGAGKRHLLGITGGVVCHQTGRHRGRTIDDPKAYALSNSQACQVIRLLSGKEQSNIPDGKWTGPKTQEFDLTPRRKSFMG